MLESTVPHLPRHSIVASFDGQTSITTNAQIRRKAEHQAIGIDRHAFPLPARVPHATVASGNVVETRCGHGRAGIGISEAPVNLTQDKEMTMSNKHRVVLVTGGMGGLGETIATKMADEGYKVVVTYSPSNKTHGEWVKQMKENGYEMVAVPCDVADYDSCVKAVAEVHDKVGAIDVLVNNAGITRDTTFKKMDKVNWDAVLRTNLDSLFNMTKQVADGM
ncbi:MAG: SDR family NAD(P)-dependent oxidoreductase, partial [Ideonella sp.]